MQQLASLLVQMWLKIVKEETKPMLQNKIESILANDISLQKMNIIESLKSSDPVINENVTGVTTKNEIDSECNITEIDSFTKEKNCYQLTMKDGNQVLQKLPSTDVDDKIKSSDESDEKEKKKDSSSEKSRSSSSSSKHHKKSKSSSSSKDRTSNSKSSSTSKSSSSSKDKHRDKDKSSSSSKLSDSSNKDKHKDKSKKDKERSDKHRSNGEIKKSGSSGSHKDKERRESKEKRAEKEKEKQAEKDKDTLSKLQSQQNIQKLGRIPKKGQEESSDDKKNADEVKKTSSMSIEVRKSGEERPKTVKIFNSKMRSTGLLEEAKPPPPRSAVNKKVPPTIPSNLPLKRSSPVREAIPPPEKRTKLDIPERPGSIKLIPPKPKRKLIFEHLLNWYFLFFRLGTVFLSERTSINFGVGDGTLRNPAKAFGISIYLRNSLICI